MSDRLSSIERLAGDAWRHFAALADRPFVVRPALPILFFGDSAAYRRSARKIITVGLNPSQREFPADAPFQRFAGGEPLYQQGLRADETQRYLELLGGYFRGAPYRSWFGCFEPILNGLAASYYGGQPNTALNTDLCSPLATAPTWSGLRPAERALLMDSGVDLWHRLVEYLQPDVLLISVATRLRTLLRLELRGPWRSIYTIERRRSGEPRRPYSVEAAPARLASGRPTWIVFGRAAHTPFGLITNADKQAIGAAVGALLDYESGATSS